MYKCTNLILINRLVVDNFPPGNICFSFNSMNIIIIVPFHMTYPKMYTFRRYTNIHKLKMAAEMNITFNRENDFNCYRFEVMILRVSRLNNQFQISTYLYHPT